MTATLNNNSLIEASVRDSSNCYCISVLRFKVLFQTLSLMFDWLLKSSNKKAIIQVAYQ